MCELASNSSEVPQQADVRVGALEHQAASESIWTVYLPVITLRRLRPFLLGVLQQHRPMAHWGGGACVAIWSPAIQRHQALRAALFEPTAPLSYASGLLALN